MTATPTEIPPTTDAARTVLATALSEAAAPLFGGDALPYALADALLSELYLVPVSQHRDSDRLAVISAVQRSLGYTAGHPVWVAEAVVDELTRDGYTVRRRPDSDATGIRL